MIRDTRILWRAVLLALLFTVVLALSGIWR